MTVSIIWISSLAGTTIVERREWVIDSMAERFVDWRNERMNEQRRLYGEAEGNYRRPTSALWLTEQWSIRRTDVEGPSLYSIRLFFHLKQERQSPSSDLRRSDSLLPISSLNRVCIFSTSDVLFLSDLWLPLAMKRLAVRSTCPRIFLPLSTICSIRTEDSIEPLKTFPLVFRRSR